MLQLSLLGGVTFTYENGTPLAFRSQTEQALLIYLAQSGQTHSRESIADLLWESSSTRQSLSNLRTVLTRLRKKVGDVLVITRTTVAYAPEARRLVDSVRLTEQLRTLRTVTDEATARQLRAALRTYNGEFLSGFFLRNEPRFNDWMVIEQERIRQQVVAGYECLLAFETTLAMPDRAIDTAQHWLRWDPLNEATHRHLMQLLAQSGQLNAAKAQYEKCAALLDAELGVAPQQATRALYEQIRQSQSGTGARQTHNLPRQMRPLFGRNEAIDQLTEHLLQSRYPLISMTGVGGTGKTSLALAVGHALLAEKHPYVDGIWFIPLEGIKNAPLESIQDQLATAIGHAIGLFFHDDNDHWSQLIKQLAAKKMLLILDNVEQFHRTASDLMLALVSSAPALKLLVTSRTSLALPGNLAFPLRGLTLPTPETPATAHRRNPGVQLFAERAAQTPAPLNINTHLDQVVAICRFVEGLPLGIELAAAALDRLTIDEILPALSDNLRLLDAVHPQLPARQRTVHAVFDTSWQLLAPREQMVLAQLSIFRGGFTRQAANTILGTDASALYYLQHHALLRRDETGRFSLHPLVRQLAYERLDAQATLASAVTEQHGMYYSNLAHTRAEELRRGHGQTALDTLFLEQANLRAAWHNAIAAGRWKIVATCLDGLHYYYQRIGLFSERAVLIEAAIAALELSSADDTHAKQLLSRLLITQAWGYLRDAQLATGITTASCAADLAEATGDVAVSAQAHLIWARLLIKKVDHEQALAHFEQVVALAKECGDPLLEADGWAGIGSCHLNHPDPQPAEEPLQRALALCKTHDYKMGELTTLSLLGGLAHRQNASAQAVGYFQTMLQLCRDIGDVASEAEALGSLGVLLSTKGDLSGALTYFDEALAIYRRLNMPESEVWMLSQLGLNATRTGNYASAEPLLDEALQIAETIDDVYWQAKVKQQLAVVWIEQGRADAALPLLTQAREEAVRSRHPVLPTQIDLVWGWALLQLGDWAGAEAQFAATFAFWHDQGQPNDRDAVAGLAGQAYTLHRQSKMALAQSRAEQLWQTWQTDPSLIEQLEMRTFWLLGTVWQELADERTEMVWRLAQTELRARSRKIANLAMRRSFLDNVPIHRALMVGRPHDAQT